MTKDKKEEDLLLGGQAVIEGVMMRSPNYYTVAVRREDGTLEIRRRHKPRITEKHPILGWPVIRGIMLLGQILVIGIQALNFSAAVATEEEDKKKGKSGEHKSEMSRWSMFLMLTFAVVIAFCLIVFLPLWLTDMTKLIIPALGNPLLYNTFDGLYRVAIFLSYILLISLLPDIRRVFQYHGAEHMSVHASEQESEITLESARKHCPYHPRCGTSFLLLVMIIAVVVFSFTPTESGLLLKLALRTPLVPLIAGLSYEALRLTARLQGHRLLRVLSAPGLWLQRLTARKPTDDQLAVAVVALRDVIELEERFEGGPIPEELERATEPADT